MKLTTRIVLGFAIALPACDVAEASNDEIAMSDGGEGRVLGKRAFDSAAAGYPAFARLSTEAPRRTLSRATDRLDLLEDDLGKMRVHMHADALGAEIVHAEELVRAARDAIATTNHDATITDTQVDSVVALVAEAQRVLDDVREQRVRAQS
jgi:hypothetical protein